LAFAAAPLARAQADRASVTGTVTDPSGAAVPGVTVSATNDNTGVVVKTETNGVGLYRVMNLPIGPYTLTFEKSGFKTLVRKGITLTIGQVAEINVELSVGSVKETVEVSTRAPLLQTQNAAVGATITNQVLQNLPLNFGGGVGRDVENFAFEVMPNVDGNSWTSYIAGTPAFSKSVLLDGTLEQGSESGGFSEMFPSLDAIQELNVDVGGTTGQIGAYTGSGTMLVTLKSGTNQWHGTGFEYLRNTALNANPWMNNWSGVPTPRDHEDDFGFSVGGPIKKDRTFFYWAWEKYTLGNFAMSTATVPTPGFLGGDFSSLLGGPILDSSGNQIVNPCTGQPYLKGQIFDPTTATTVNGQACATPFPSNQIPTARFSKVAQQLIPTYQQDYKPINGGDINNAQTPASNNPWLRMNQYSLKMDHNLSQRDRLSGSFIETSRPRYLIDSGSSVWQPGTTTGGPFAQTRLQDVFTHQLRLSESHTLSPTTLNETSVTFLSFHNPSTPVTAGGGWGQRLGFAPFGNYGGIPKINFSGTVNGVSEATIGENNSGKVTTNIFAYEDKLTKVIGRHSMSLGGAFRAFEQNSHGNAGTLNFTFSNAQTGQPTNSKVAPNVGFAFASFLLGDVNSASEGTPFNLYGRRKELTLYASDDFKVNRKMTLNLGLSWNQDYAWHEKYGNWANWGTTLPSPMYGIPGAIEYASGGGASFEGAVDWTAFAPHVGMAYMLTPKIVARASYSMYYLPIGSNYWGGVPYSFAPQETGTDIVNTTGIMAAAFNWDSGYPGVFVPGTKNANWLSWGPVSISPQSLKPGRVNEWNIGTEIAIAHNTRLSIYYLGNRGTGLQDGELQNDGPTAAQEPAYFNMLKNGAEWDWVSDASSAAAAGVPYPYPGYSGEAFQALSSFPQVASQWSPLFFVGSPLGKSQFDSITAEITRRAAPGLSMDMSYVYERQATDVDPGYGNFQETWTSCSYDCVQDINYLSFAANHVSPYGQNIVKGYVQYDLPFGRGGRLLSHARGPVNAALGGWRVALIVSYSSGGPITVDSTNYYPGWPMVVYSNVAPGANFASQFSKSGFAPITSSITPTASQDPNRYFGTSAFTNPAYGSLGNSGPWVKGLYGFGWADEDLGIYKEFKVSERVRVQLLGQFFNALNRHHFNNPVTDMNSPLFGYVTSVSGAAPRNTQVGVHIYF
jgi:hypothetical protein